MLGFQKRKVGNPGLGQCSTNPEERGGRGELGNRSELGSVKQESGAKVIASFCNSHFVIQVERGGNMVLMSLCDLSPTSPRLWMIQVRSHIWVGDPVWGSNLGWAVCFAGGF